ncbi:MULTISPECIES: thymidylate synthase [unclassified Bradyrhizobium]|uniref:thymidylate synthase n=1 Tax=unclassified Bradyrhizobium TaxID=2631580 RepID=UPI0033946E9D
MFISRETLDDVLLELYPQLLVATDSVTATRGSMIEVVGALLEITKPRARLSRSETRGKLFSGLGELLWYLTRDNRLDFIERYIHRYRKESEDKVTVYGGYGPRLFSQRGCNQIENVINLLRLRPTSRKAVIQIFNAEDIDTAHAEIPCTTSLQFLIRHGALDLVVTMRSNDAYIGLPHDVFCFTMLQEIMSRALGLDIGVYRHFVASLHLYEDNRSGAQHFLDEGYQQRIEMPEMPQGDPWPMIAGVLEAEKRIRNAEKFEAGSLDLSDYWTDLVRLLQAFFAESDEERIALLDQMAFRRYRPYVLGRLDSARGT